MTVFCSACCQPFEDPPRYQGRFIWMQFNLNPLSTTHSYLCIIIHVPHAMVMSICLMVSLLAQTLNSRLMVPFSCHAIQSWCMVQAVNITFILMLHHIAHNVMVTQAGTTKSFHFKSLNSPHLGVMNKTRQIWGIWKLRPAYSPETPNLGQNWWCFVSCDLEIWWMTLENNRASLLCCFKLCATFHSHWWIQTGVTVRKRPIWVKFDDF